MTPRDEKRGRRVSRWVIAGLGAAAITVGVWLVHRPPRVPVAVVRKLPTTAPVRGERVVLIRKADRVLAFYREGKLAATYPVALSLWSAVRKNAGEISGRRRGSITSATAIPSPAFTSSSGSLIPTRATPKKACGPG